MKKKTIAVVLALVLVICCAVGGVLAYLTATSGPIKNTFTVGKVDITLDEEKTDVYGVPVEPTARVTDGNAYKLIPGHTYTKDPTVTVVGGSEKCYLFVKVDAVNAELITYTVDTVSEKWQKLSGVDGVYYRVVDAKDADQPFTVLTGNQFSVKENTTAEELAVITAENPSSLTFTAYAVQAEGFDSATEAWTAANFS